MTCVSLLFFGCTKGDYEGPAINDLYGDFMITDSFRIINNNPDFSVVEKADWIVEAVVERIDIKHQIYDKIFKSPASYRG